MYVDIGDERNCVPKTFEDRQKLPAGLPTRASTNAKRMCRFLRYSS